MSDFSRRFYLGARFDVVHAVRNNLWDWQSLSPTSGGGTFFEFCDALEVDANGNHAPAAGFGLQHALSAWGSYLTNTYLPTSKSRNVLSLAFVMLTYLQFAATTTWSA